MNNELNTPDYCPRCDSTGISILTQSPVPRAWTIYQCPVCLFAWRSIEPLNITSKEHYAKAFKINPSTILDTPMFPRIPPLNEKS